MRDRSIYNTVRISSGTRLRPHRQHRLQRRDRHGTTRHDVLCNNQGGSADHGAPLCDGTWPVRDHGQRSGARLDRDRNGECRTQRRGLPSARSSTIATSVPPRSWSRRSQSSAGTTRSAIRPMPTPSSTGSSTMPTASSCGATRCAAANRICLGMKRINQINNL